LKPEHFTNGDAYKMLPVGYVHRLQFEAMIQPLQKLIASTEEKLDQCKGEVGDLKFCRSWQALDQKQSQIAQLEYQLHNARSRLLGIVMACEPILDATFSDTLAAHLDSMLDAYLELRKLQAEA
jgi:hypothetical protein